MQCQRCRSNNRPGAIFCGACGLSLSTSTGTGSGKAVAISGVAQLAGSPAKAGQLPWPSWFGGHQSSVDGVVVQIDPTYNTPAVTNWPRRLIVAVVLSPLLLVALVSSLIVRLFWRMVVPGGRRSLASPRGFFGGIMSQVVGFALTKHLLGEQPDMPVRDVRVRDASGSDHLVRIEGHLLSGNVAVGDTVSVTGVLRHGTTVLRWGYNHRTKSEIRVK